MASKRRPPKGRPQASSLNHIPEVLMPRAKALVLMLDVLEGQSLQHSLEQSYADLDPKDRGFALELLMGSLRCYWPLQRQVQAHIKTPLKKQAKWLEAVLIMGAYQLHHMNAPARAVIHSSVELVRLFGYDHLTGLANAVLRAVDRAEPTPPMAIHDYLNTGHWLFRALFENWKPYFLRILEQMAQQPPVYLRRRSLQCDVLNLLSDGGVEFSTTELETCVQLEQSIPISQLPGFDTGKIVVQDLSAQKAVAAFSQQILELLSKAPTSAPLTILDGCAAPGGKTAALADALPAGTGIYAVDIEPLRVQRTQENLKRLGLTHVQVSCTDLAKPDGVEQIQQEDGFDHILLDVPCSGTGVIGRHPDIFWCRRESDIETLVATQRELLKTAYTLLKPGGLLMYVTCSILKQENVENLEWYQQTHRDHFIEIPMSDTLGMKQNIGYQKLPSIDSQGDGFYYALLRKQG